MQLHRTTRLLLAARALRSLGQGVLVVAFVIYLHALHLNGFTIGLILSAAGFAGAVFNLIVGITSDQLGRKPFLLFIPGPAVGRLKHHRGAAGHRPVHPAFPLIRYSPGRLLDLIPILFPQV